MSEELTYPLYLELDGLLKLQNLRSSPEHPDELLFIVVHQASELWFKLLVHELNRLSASLEAFDTLGALERLTRINGVMTIINTQMTALDTLGPQCFAQFRKYLGTSSGAQSVQFRLVELLSGLRAPDFIEYLLAHGPVDPRITEALERPSVSELFDRLLAHHNITGDDLYANDDHRDLRLLAEALMAYEVAFGEWRYSHVMRIERIIGPNTSGTGGSSGGQALRATLNNQFFPKLWAVRSTIFFQS